MTRATTLLVLLVGVALLPSLVTAQTSVSLTKIRLLDGNGHDLRIAPKDGLLTLETIMNNTGPTTINGTLSLNFKLEAVNGGFTDTRTLTAQGPVAPDEEATFTYAWPSTNRDLGDYRATAQMTSPASGSALVATFTVADDAVAAGDMVDRVADYYWFFGVFLLATILFFVVLAARRS